MNQRTQNQNLVYAALLLAAAMILPLLTGQIPQIGQMLLPMHLPVVLCGFLCGWPWGLAIGAIAPILRSAIFGMPVMFPMAIAMSFELAVKGAAAGAIYNMLPKKTSSIYATLVIAMILSRLVYGGVQYLLLGLDTGLPGLITLWTGSVTTALPGILLQLVLIPILVRALGKNDFLKKTNYA